MNINKNITRNNSQEVLNDPVLLAKNFAGISKIKKEKNSKYNIEMISKIKNKKEIHLYGKEKDLNRLCLLFGYNKLNVTEIMNNIKNEFIPTPLRVSFRDNK